MASFWSVITLVLLIGVIVASAYVAYDNWPREAVKFKHKINVEERLNEGNSINYSRSKQFYSNLRFPSNRISYIFDPACSDVKVEQVDKAFQDIERRTNLTFFEKDDGDLEITCSELAPDPKIKDHFIAGEGGPIEILNGSVYAVIVKGKISLYRDENCDGPHIATHELLHVLGFDHNNDPNSILYPTLDCSQKVDDYLIDEINRLYSAPSRPDLAFLDVDGNRTGKYTSFQVSIDNQGLANIDSFSLRVLADGKKIKDFDLGNLTIATRKILTITNLNVGRTAKEIKLQLDADNLIDELKEDNNELVLND